MKRFVALLLALLLLPLSVLADEDDWSFFVGIRGKEFAFPEGTEKVDDLYNCQIGTLILPASLKEWDNSCVDYSTVDAFEVAEGNPYFKAADGVLYSLDGKTLIAYPNGRESVHFTVLEGVENIAHAAFSANLSLTGLSLPFGLREIGEAAFYRCGALVSVSLPLTVETVGNAAFSDCVNLERVSMSESLRETLSRTPFDEWDDPFSNCPMLSGNTFSAGEGVLSTRTEADGSKFVSLIASPESANGHAVLFSKPDETSAPAALIPSGTVIHARDEQTAPGWLSAWFYDGKKDVDGYIRKSEIVFPQSGTYFVYADVLPENDQVRLLMDDGEVREMNYARYKEELEEEYGCSGSDMVFSGFYDPFNGKSSDACWLVACIGEMIEDGAAFSIRDAFLTRKYTGDSRTLGVIIASEGKKRVNLRPAPMKTGEPLAKYYTGTQVEILEEKGDWYRIALADGNEGWMMKEYVRIVQQEGM